MAASHHQWERVTIELRTQQNMHMRRMHIIMVIPKVPCCFMFELSFFPFSFPFRVYVQSLASSPLSVNHPLVFLLYLFRQSLGIFTDMYLFVSKYWNFMSIPIKFNGIPMFF